VSLQKKKMKTLSGIAAVNMKIVVIVSVLVLVLVPVLV